MTASGRGWGMALLVGLAGAMMLGLIGKAVIDHAVHYDELLHILSARGLLQTGQPVIADGIYTRVQFFTSAVAWSFHQFGESPVIARLPALAAGAVLAFVLGVWATRRAGMLAGFLAVLLFCMVPATQDVAVFARFYTLHSLIVTLLFIAVFESLNPARALTKRIGWILVALGLTPVAWYLQDTTMIAVGAVMVGIVAVLVLDQWATVRSLVSRSPVLVVGGLVLLGAVVIAAVLFSGLLSRLGKTALWASANADRVQYYLVAFRDSLPLLWPLLPLASVVAVAAAKTRRLAIFCILVAASALIVHSIAAQKSVRYVHYVVPLLCVIWACAASELIAHVRSFCRNVGMYRAGVSTVLGLALIGSVLVLSQEGARFLNLAAGRLAHGSALPFQDEPDWTEASEELVSRAREADTVVTSNSMKALYYLGRYDFELNATIVPETETGAEFGRDRRTGRQAIGSADSIQNVLARPGGTLVVIEASKIGRASGVTTDAFAVVESHCGELDLPAGTGVRAWWCVTPP